MSVERSHVAIRDRLRCSRGLKSVIAGQRFLEGFEAVQALSRGDVLLRQLVPRLPSHPGHTSATGEGSRGRNARPWRAYIEGCLSGEALPVFGNRHTHGSPAPITSQTHAFGQSAVI